MNSLYGMPIYVSKDRPNYVLPDEVIPGVPWPPGFKQEIDEWSFHYLGTWNPIPVGKYYVINDSQIHMNEHDYVKVVTEQRRP